MTGLEVALPGRSGKAIPWTNDLAVITAKHPVADQRAQFFRDSVLQLDRQVGNAAAGIQLVGADKGVRGADIQTGGAFSAVFGGVRWIDRQRQVDEQLAQEEITASLAVEHEGVLADPAEAGLFGDGFFQYRGAVDKGAVTERADDRLDFFCQLLHAFTDQFVVIAAQRITRDVGFFRLAEHMRHLRIARQVVHAQGHYAQRARHQFLGVRAFAAMGAHIVHFAVVAGLEPALQMLLVLGEVQAADADLLEAQLAAPVLDGLGEGGEICGSGRHVARETGAEMRIILPDIGARRRMPHIKDDFPDALYSAAQIRALDAQLIAAGTTGFELMQRAARATWRAIVRRWPKAAELTVMTGHGNNAGDGFLVATLARRAGWSVRVLTVGEPRRLQGDAAIAHAEAVAVGVPLEAWTDESELRGVLLDALLGTGLSGDVREPYVRAIDTINVSGLPVTAVDIPSGLCSDTGRVLGTAVTADLTVTFIGLKQGLFTGDAADRVGELVFDDLHADPDLVESAPFSARLLSQKNLPRLTPRAPTSHKGSFGHVLLIGGDRGFGGAILMSAESALRCGAGMVSMATRSEHVSAALTRLPEVMAQGTHSANQLMGLLEQADVLVVGPGLGQAAWGRSLLSAVTNAPLPQVWDADALNLLSTGAVSLPEHCVITPHPGEAARLLALSTAQVQADRPAAALALSRKYTATVILKGAGSLIASPDGRLAVCSQGHPAMATAGLGDVLAGVVGALLAQGMEGFEAACLAVWLHANAGEQAGRSGRGLAATDLIPAIRQLLEEQSPCLK